MTSKISTETNIKSQIKAGYVLHLDFEWILLTYGDATTGMSPNNNIGPRYGLCIGVNGDETFWVTLTSGAGDNRQRIPDQAKVGSWAGNGQATYFPTNQVWEITREMAFEAYAQANGVKKGFKHSYVTPSGIEPWPALPVRYPRNFTPLTRKIPDLPPLVRAQASPTPTTHAAITVGAELLAVMPTNIPAALQSEEPQMSTTKLSVDEPLSINQLDAPSASVRDLAIARIIKICANTRLTDEEICLLAKRMEDDAIRTLLGD